MTKIYALIGSTANVDKSWGPTIHNAWLKHYKIDAEYIGFGHDGQYQDIIEALKKRKDVHGVNITTPFKGYERNRNVIKDFQNICYDTSNTDGYGFTKAFEPYVAYAKSSLPILILGEGCVAQVIKSELSKTGIDSMTFPRYAVRLLETEYFNRGQPFGEFVIDALAGKSKIKLGKAHVTVNYDKDTPTDAFPIQMLLHQAAKSFEIWHGFLPDIKIAEHAILEEQKKLTNQS